MVPARNEFHVVDSTVYRNLKSAWSTWVSKPGSPREELRVARAIVPERCRDVSMLIMNVSSYPLRLESGEVLSELEPAELIPDDDVLSLEWSEEPILVPEYVQTLADGVDPTVAEDVRQALSQILLRFPTVFSQGENDLGRASAVQH